VTRILNSTFLFSILFTALSWARPAEQPTRFEAVNPAGAPVSVVPAGHLDGTKPFRLKFRLTNTSKEFLPWVELTASVFRPNGELKGFHSFVVNTNLRAGQERFFHYSTTTFEIEPADRVQIGASLVRLSSRAWSPPAQ